MYKYHQKSLFFLKKIAFTLAKLAFSYANSCFYPVFQKVAFTFSINLFVKIKDYEPTEFKIEYPNPKYRNICLSTISMANPSKMADIDYIKTYIYSNKILPNKPSFITFVANPWFNQDRIDLDLDFFRTYSRQFSKNVFTTFNCKNKYLKDKKDNNTSVTYSDFSHNLTGIIFIVDRSITETSSIYELCIYINPLCVNNNSINKSEMKEAFNECPLIKIVEIDDFSNLKSR